LGFHNANRRLWNIYESIGSTDVPAFIAQAISPTRALILLASYNLNPGQDYEFFVAAMDSSGSRISYFSSPVTITFN
jgi:hypothetical protein